MFFVYSIVSFARVVPFTASCILLICLYVCSYVRTYHQMLELSTMYTCLCVSRFICSVLCRSQHVENLSSCGVYHTSIRCRLKGTCAAIFHQNRQKTKKTKHNKAQNMIPKQNIIQSVCVSSV